MGDQNQNHVTLLPRPFSARASGAHHAVIRKRSGHARLLLDGFLYYVKEKEKVKQRQNRTHTYSATKLTHLLRENLPSISPSMHIHITCSLLMRITARAVAYGKVL